MYKKKSGFHTKSKEESMKKIIITLCFSMLILSNHNPIKANENPSILVHIKNASDCYLIEFDEEKMHVKIISNSLYLPIPALNNEAHMLKDVQFSSNYYSLVSSIQTFLETKIDVYASIDIKEILELLHLDPSMYDYKSLASLTKTASKIKHNLNLKTLLKYTDYIETNMDIETLYTIYKKCKNEKLNVSYYTLTYFISEKGYITFDKSFHPRKK